MCGYCGCESIDVVGRLMREHVDIINATGVPASRRRGG